MIAALHLRSLLAIVLLAVPLLFLSLLTLLLWLTEVDLQLASLKHKLWLLFRSLGRISLFKAHEARLRLRNDLARLYLTKVLKEFPELVLGAGGVHIPHNQIQQVHALLELECAFLDLTLPLPLVFVLSHIQALLRSCSLDRLQVVLFVMVALTIKLEMVEGFLGIFALAEADKSEVP